MVCAKNYETMSTFVKVMQKNRSLFFFWTRITAHVRVLIFYIFARINTNKNAIAFLCRFKLRALYVNLAYHISSTIYSAVRA